MSEFVDVIIPTRNRFRMTVAAVSSVLGQTHVNSTIFVVDDASDDGSGEQLVDRFREEQRVRVVRRSVTGRAAAARQTGFEAGSLPWIATLDSDDLWHPEKLERQLAAADGFDVVLCWHTWLKMDGSPRVTRRPTGAGAVSPLLTSNVDVALMRRDTVAAVGGFVGDEHTPIEVDENIDFFIRPLANSRAVVVEEVLAWCRDHTNPRTSDGMSPDSLRSIVEARRPLLEPHGDDFAELLCRLGARYASCGSWRRWLSYTTEGMKRASTAKRMRLLGDFGPHAARQAALSMRGRRAVR